MTITTMAFLERGTWVREFLFLYNGQPVGDTTWAAEFVVHGSDSITNVMHTASVANGGCEWLADNVLRVTVPANVIDVWDEQQVSYYLRIIDPVTNPDAGGRAWLMLRGRTDVLGPDATRSGRPGETQFFGVEGTVTKVFGLDEGLAAATPAPVPAPPPSPTTVTALTLTAGNTTLLMLASEGHTYFGTAVDTAAVDARAATVTLGRKFSLVLANDTGSAVTVTVRLSGSQYTPLVVAPNSRSAMLLMYGGNSTVVNLGASNTPL